MEHDIVLSADELSNSQKEDLPNLLYFCGGGNNESKEDKFLDPLNCFSQILSQCCYQMFV